MQISDTGLALVKLSEGFRDMVYLDVAGIPTIGYGHRLLHGEQFLNGIDEALGTTLLREDIAWAERAVSAMVKVPLTPEQFDALVDFVYNIGAGVFQRSTLLILLNQGKYAAVPAELAKYDRAGGKVCVGLEARREAESKLWVQAA